MSHVFIVNLEIFGNKYFPFKSYASCMIIFIVRDFSPLFFVRNRYDSDKVISSQLKLPVWCL